MFRPPKVMPHTYPPNLRINTTRNRRVSDESSNEYETATSFGDDDDAILRVFLEVADEIIFKAHREFTTTSYIYNVSADCDDEHQMYTHKKTNCISDKD